MKVKIFKLYDGGCYECDAENILAAASVDWEEVTGAEFEKLRDAVYYANRYTLTNSSRGFNYCLITHEEESIQEVYSSYSVFLEEQREKEATEKAKKAAAVKKKNETSLERKKKQLEKLQKELEGK